MKLYGSRDGDPAALLLWALGEAWGFRVLPPLARTERGKPYFPQFPGLHFNLSHSGQLTLCALSHLPVGVDIEQLRPHIHDISYRTYYRRRKEAVYTLSTILWGYTTRDSLALLEEFFPESTD